MSLFSDPIRSQSLFQYVSELVRSRATRGGGRVRYPSDTVNLSSSLAVVSIDQIEGLDRVLKSRFVNGDVSRLACHGQLPLFSCEMDQKRKRCFAPLLNPRPQSSDSSSPQREQTPAITNPKLLQRS